MWIAYGACVVGDFLTSMHRNVDAAVAYHKMHGPSSFTFASEQDAMRHALRTRELSDQALKSLVSPLFLPWKTIDLVGMCIATRIN